MSMTATPAVRHLQRLDELINRVVRDADLIHDYVQLRFHGGLVLTLNNGVELDGQLLSNSPAGRIAARLDRRPRRQRCGARSRPDRPELPRRVGADNGSAAVGVALAAGADAVPSECVEVGARVMSALSARRAAAAPPCSAS